METTQVEITTQDGVRLVVTQYIGDSGAMPRRDVVFLHGWPNAGRVWRLLADALLLGGGWRILAPTFRGFGDSGRPDSGYNCLRFAEDVADVVAALALTNFSLVGHSMGGKIAQVYAARQPVGLTALALVAPVPLVAAPVAEEKKAAQRAIYGDSGKTRALLAGMAAHPLPGDALTLLVEDGLKAGQAAWNGWIDPMREEDFTADAARIAVPTLVVGGGRDPLRDEAALRRDVVERIGGAEYARLPNSGHLPHLEEPSALAALLVNFLEQGAVNDAAG